MKDLTIVGKDKFYKLGNKTKTFYYGGVDKSFNISQIDIYKTPENNENNVGFYMYGEKNYIDLVNHIIKESELKNITDKGIAKITMTDNLQIYTLPSYTKIGLNKEQLKDLKEQGYDLIKGIVVDKEEYILLNKIKISNIEFISLDKSLELLTENQLKGIRNEINKQNKQR